MSHRLFVAIRVEPNQKIKDLVKFIEKFESTKAVEEENLHVNLKFLGDTDDEGMEKAKEALKELKGFGEFKATLKDVGAFPNQDFIKVIWLGVESDKIDDLAKETEKAYTEKGFKDRKRPYKAHLTIARVKQKPGSDIKKIFTEKHDREYKEIKIQSAELIESELTSEGPVYKTVESVEL